MAKLRSSDEIGRKIEELKGYESNPFYKKSLEVLSWARDKTDIQIRGGFIDFSRKLRGLPLDSTGHNAQITELRYEAIAFLWLLGNNMQPLLNIRKVASIF